MSEQYFFCMDSETGGLRSKKTDVLTLFMSVLDENFKVVDELDLKLRPENRLPIVEEEAMKINKIDLQKHLADPNIVTYPEAKTKIVNIAKKYLKKRGRYSNLVVLGQNVGFDLRFIWEHIMPEEEWDQFFSYNIEDTKASALFLKRCGWLPKEVGTLQSLVEFFNVPKQTAHEARGDVVMTVEVYKKMIELMKSKKDGGGNQDLISLLEAE